MSEDPTNPDHYRWHPTGIEAIEVTEHFTKNLGNAVDYIWRAGRKTPDPRKDLRKAIWYLTREIERYEKFELPNAPHARAKVAFSPIMAPAPAGMQARREGAAAVEAALSNIARGVPPVS